MAKGYPPRSLDEEPFLEKGDRTEVHEGLTWTGESESFTSVARTLSPHWLLCENIETPATSAVKYETQHFDLPPIAEGPFIVGDTMISREEMINLGLNPDTSLKITDPRNGKPGYRVAVEVFHQLHCLNLLRQNVYKDYYSPLGGDTSAPMMDLRGHLDHCIDALRQFVMCQGDIGVFSFNYPFNDGDPWPDYSTPHTCRNFESIRQWAVDHTVPRGPDEPEH
ncbi:hypothetical protein ONZ43_g3738 [Nemania bipapillata]|uniref:Uncharacterized protein n=1 Tax=Nemania bipapillata TaxID=110536 RepID=A0ACC2IVV1_9PEZI|nr:hypothetical protein ONZ43_g3738 [Nemania bipapillata]